MANKKIQICLSPNSQYFRNATSFGNRVIPDVISYLNMRSYWSKVGGGRVHLTFNMTGHVKTETQGEHHVRTKAEIGVMQLSRTKEIKNC